MNSVLIPDRSCRVPARGPRRPGLATARPWPAPAPTYKPHMGQPGRIDQAFRIKPFLTPRLCDGRNGGHRCDRRRLWRHPGPGAAPGSSHREAWVIHSSRARGRATAEAAARSTETTARAAETAAAKTAASHVVVDLVLGDELLEPGETRRGVGAPETADRHDRDATGGQFHRRCAVRAVSGRRPCVVGSPALQ